MGYSHYWDNTPEISEEAAIHIKSIVDYGYDNGVIQQEDDVKEPPTATSERIWFNGIGDDGHETFCMKFPSTGFGFCKTARKPYDRIVVAVLMAIAHHHPEFEWRSDGNSDDHAEGEELFDATLIGPVYAS